MNTRLLALASVAALFALDGGATALSVATSGLSPAAQVHQAARNSLATSGYELDLGVTIDEPTSILPTSILPNSIHISEHFVYNAPDRVRSVEQVPAIISSGPSPGLGQSTTVIIIDVGKRCWTGSSDAQLSERPCQPGYDVTSFTSLLRSSTLPTEVSEHDGTFRYTLTRHMLSSLPGVFSPGINQVTVELRTSEGDVVWERLTSHASDGAGGLATLVEVLRFSHYGSAPRVTVPSGS